MGEGHNATARGLAEAARALWPDVEISRVDTLDVMGPGVGPLFRRIYVANVESTPWLYEYFYASLWRHRWFANACKRFVAEWGGRQFGSVVRREQPDLILSTYPLGSSALGWLRRRGRLPMPTAAWISDFAPHPFWVHRELDGHFVMHEAAVAPALTAVPDAVVAVCAPPVVGAFRPADAAVARKQLGLPVDAVVALVSCGALGFGSVERAVKALVAGPPAVHVVAVCGRNAALRRRLMASYRDNPRLTVLGWTDQMPEWTAAADVVVTNAGGATSLEALASARPVIMFEPIAAHGRANAELMHEAGLAELCLTPAELTRVITELVDDPTRGSELTGAVIRHLDRHDLAQGLQDLAGRLPPGGVDAPRRRIRAADSFFLDVETPTVAQHVGTVVDLGVRADGSSLTLHQLRRTVAERIPALPTLRRRLADPGATGPVRYWVDDPAPDLDTLITAAPVRPGQSPEQAVDRFFATALDRRSPLWRIHLLEGLPEGHSIVLIKLHHSLGDGLSAIGTLDGLLDRSATPPASPTATASRGVTAQAATTSGSGGGASGRCGAGLRSGWAVAGGLAGLAMAGPAARAGARARRSGGHPHVVLATLSTTAVQTVARSLRVSSGELMLSVLADALSRLLGSDEPVRPGQTVRAMVPLSLRQRVSARPGPDSAADEPAPARSGLQTWGNWTGAVPIDLPIGPLTARERLRLVRADLARKASGGQPRAAQAVVAGIGRLPGTLHARAARRVYQGHWFDLIASYMPAARGRRYIAGCPLATAHPVLPLAQGVGLAVGILARGAEIGVGVTADPHLIPRADRLPGLLADAFAELATAAKPARA